MKYCCFCGTALPDTAAFCSACGKAVEEPIARPVAQEAPAAPAAPAVVYEQPFVQPMPGQAPKGGVLFPILALAAGIVALIFGGISLSVVSTLVLPLFAVANGVCAIIFAGKARGARLRGMAVAGKVVAIIGLVIGGLALLTDVTSLFGSGALFGDYGSIFDA